MKKLLIIPLLSLVSDFVMAQADNPECAGKTITFFTTFDGFYIDRCKDSEFTKYDFWLDGSARKVEKEGKYRETWFFKKKDNTRKVSGLQIIQNHVNALKKVGGEVVKGSDDGIYRTTYNGNELWIHLKVYSGNQDVDNFAIYSVEIQAMKQEVTAKDIKGAMETQGKIALYGIYFDTGKSDIKTESDKAMKEIASYLNANQAVSVYIVGHTDSEGDFAANLRLSKTRGDAIVKALVASHKISASRLTADGVGSLCPVASNATEDGRRMNRRVEIVLK